MRSFAALRTTINSHRRNTAVDDDLRAGHEARFVGRQEHQRPAHFFGPAQPSDRYLAAELLLHDVVAEAVAVLVEDRRVGERGVEGIAAEIVARFGPGARPPLASNPHARLG